MTGLVPGRHGNPARRATAGTGPTGLYVGLAGADVGTTAGLPLMVDAPLVRDD